MAKIKIDEQEYNRLKDIEQKYFQLLADQAAMHSPVEKPTDSAEDGDTQTVDAAWEDFKENYMDQAEAFDREQAASEQAPPDQEADGMIVMEYKFGTMDAWTILNRLNAMCKISGEGDKVPSDNIAFFGSASGVQGTVHFTANAYQQNSKIKLDAKDIIWNATRQCALLESVREAQLLCTIEPNELWETLCAEMQRQNCTPLFATAHGISGQPHLHILWMDDNREKTHTISDFLKTEVFGIGESTTATIETTICFGGDEIP